MSGMHYDDEAMQGASREATPNRVANRSTEPTLDDLRSEFPRWEIWTGVNYLLYARLPLTTPPVTLRGEDTVDLRDQIRGYLGCTG